MSASAIQELLANNRAWAESQTRRDAEFFTRLAGGQRPRFLWIGCSDSRVPVNLITGLPPGDVFVHRNIANRVVSEDSNLQAVLQYAIEVLRVAHIVVCGHYGCGGVKAALEGSTSGVIRGWLEPVRTACICSGVCASGPAGPLSAAVWKRACEAHTLEQLVRLRANPFVQDAQAHGQGLSLHALIYDLADGRLRVLD
ncbi:MAG: carbonic anhydrase [Cellvibrionales bacterium]|nr:carbonic anhydrase [Cellvibrionales bacterium]